MQSTRAPGPPILHHLLRLPSLLGCAVLLATAPALGLTLEVTHAGPSVVGESHAFTAVAAEANGAVTYSWKFGDAADFEDGAAETLHTFDRPGLHSIDVVATDAGGETASVFFQHLAHYPLTPERPTSSTSIVYDAVRNRVYSLNQDNDTVTALDAELLTKVGEVEVYKKPEALALAPDGKLWVVHQDDYAVAVVDLEGLAVERGFRLPYASQPIGIVMSPTGDAAYVSLRATGKLLRLDPSTGDVTGEVAVGPEPRGIAVSHDGKTIYVTRFISPDAGGEVVEFDATALTVTKRIVLTVDSETEDNAQAARGLPNYLFSIALTPDGRQAWIPGKKDNILRGKLRDGQDLTHDTTVRPLAAVIDTALSEEIVANRVDLDDRSMPVHVEFSPYGNFAILTLAGSNRVEVRDIFRPEAVFSAISDVGKFPRASVLTPAGRLFVQGSFSRDVRVYDLSSMLKSFDQSTPPELAVIAAVANDKVPADVLEGKTLFNDTEDVRMANEGYLSCGSCHFEGTADGRTFDFSTRGEGFRNTVTLLGRAGMRHGRLNWSATLDEVQDFEHQIRELFGGRGFLPDEAFRVGTRDQPLGDPKAGLSPELDALAAYVSSLDRVSPSPYRQPDGSLTPDGVAGKAIFERLGCDFCHAGVDFTDSARGQLHDVGTLSQTSGMHAGGTLLGLDTPTLLGVWETPPYLHDGSAPTLRDVLTTRNATDAHGYVSALSSAEIDQLVAYVQQIDGEEPIHRLPFEPPVMAGGMGGMAGTSGSGNIAGGGGNAAEMAGAGSSAGLAGAGGFAGAMGGVGSGGGSAATRTLEKPPSPSCACAVAGATGSRKMPGSAASTLATLGLLAGMRLRRRQSSARVARASGWFLVAAGFVFTAGCGPSEPRGATPSGAAGAAAAEAAASGGAGGTAGAAGAPSLPPVTHPDPELVRFGSREQTIAKVCAQGRGDEFAKLLCSGTARPKIGSLGELLSLVGLGEERAFALTGNSTSLVSASVSALNPRIIVFPRVADDLTPPDAMTAVGFVRGEPFVELVSRDSATGDLSFYLLAFEQACSYESAGCDLASLLTEAIERDWTAYSVYDDADLEQTSFDCLSCHRPGGPGSKRILRMQELASPWMHWFPQRFVQRTDSDRVLMAQFTEAHAGDAQYGGIPLTVIANALDEGSGAQLEALVRAEGFGDQPNPFDGQIAVEMKSGSSATWQARFDAHLRGEAIAVPYPFVDVTDEAKRNAATRSYQDVVSGVAARESLLDIRQVFSADAPEKLSLVPQPGADGKTVLLQLCARCHDGRGNPELRKNAFDVLHLAEMPRGLKDLALERINATGVTRMPPWRAGSLTPEALQAATAELQK